jgi:hypothetical protein
MRVSTRSVALATLVATACGSGASAPPVPAPPADAGAGADARAQVAPTLLGGSLAADTTVDDAIVGAPLSIPAGRTLTVRAGAVVLVEDGVQIEIAGTLSIEGTRASPVTVQARAGAGPTRWAGVLVDAGGTLAVRFAAVRDASLAFAIDAGAQPFTLDHVLVERAQRFARLDADGTLRYGVYHGLGAQTPNGVLAVGGGAPLVVDTLVDQGSPAADLVTVGAGSPTFDHVTVRDAHCSIHVDGSLALQVTSSVLSDDVYGLMLESSINPVVRGTSVLVNRDFQIGVCSGSTGVDARGNFWGGAPPRIDSTCQRITDTTQPLDAPDPTAGVRPE